MLVASNCNPLLRQKPGQYPASRQFLLAAWLFRYRVTPPFNRIRWTGEQPAWRGSVAVSLLINLPGEILGLAWSAGNADDGKRAFRRQLIHFVNGLLVGDRGDISQAFSEALTNWKRNRRKAFLDALPKQLIKSSAWMESVIAPRKATTAMEQSWY
jgi:hypothetical protein